MNPRKRFDEVTELPANAYEENGSQGEIEELESELDLLSLKLESDDELAQDAILEGNIVTLWL